MNEAGMIPHVIFNTHYNDGHATERGCSINVDVLTVLYMAFVYYLYIRHNALSVHGTGCGFSRIQQLLKKNE